MATAFEYAILIKNKTRLETLVERFNTKAQAKFYLEHSGGNFVEYEEEDRVFHESLAIVQRRLSRVIRNKIVERAFLPSFLFSEQHLVVVVGQDGLVANTAKYVNGLPIVAINPDTDRYDGFLLPFTPGNFIGGVEAVLRGQYPYRTAPLAEARLNDGQRLLAFNDLFIGAASHVSARYRIAFGNREEEHSSSGIIVATRAGSTGWLSSVFNMANGIQQFLGTARKPPAPLGAEELMFVVREPFLSKKTKAGLTVGVLNDQNRLVIESFMPTNGVIFSDGIEADFLRFNSGNTATIGLAAERAQLVGPS